MGNLFLLSDRPMARISPHFPLAHGVPRVDDRRVVSGIVYELGHGEKRQVEQARLCGKHRLPNARHLVDRIRHCPFNHPMLKKYFGKYEERVSSSDCSRCGIAAGGGHEHQLRRDRTPVLA